MFPEDVGPLSFSDVSTFEEVLGSGEEVISRFAEVISYSLEFGTPSVVEKISILDDDASL